MDEWTNEWTNEWTDGPNDYGTLTRGGRQGTRQGDIHRRARVQRTRHGGVFLYISKPFTPHRLYKPAPAALTRHWYRSHQCTGIYPRRRRRPPPPPAAFTRLCVVLRHQRMTV